MNMFYSKVFSAAMFQNQKLFWCLHFQERRLRNYNVITSCLGHAAVLAFMNSVFEACFRYWIKERWIMGVRGQIDTHPSLRSRARKTNLSSLRVSASIASLWLSASLFALRSTTRPCSDTSWKASRIPPWWGKTHICSRHSGVRVKMTDVWCNELWLLFLVSEKRLGDCSALAANADHSIN